MLSLNPISASMLALFAITGSLVHATPIAMEYMPGSELFMPLQTRAVDMPISIEEMLGPNPTVVSTENEDGSYTYSWDDPDSDTTSKELQSRAGGFQPCSNSPCSCGTTTRYQWSTFAYSQYLGDMQRISEPLCPPGSITNSRTYSYSYSINVQAGPDLKFTAGILDKLGIRVGFSYTWGRAQTVGYTAACTESNYPCIQSFTPRIGVIVGTGYTQQIAKFGGGVCSTSAKSQMELRVPITGEQCGEGSVCGAVGVYDHCYVTGPQAKQLCPKSKLGAEPSRACPSGFANK